MKELGRRFAGFPLADENYVLYRGVMDRKRVVSVKDLALENRYIFTDGAWFAGQVLMTGFRKGQDRTNLYSSKKISGSRASVVLVR